MLNVSVYGQNEEAVTDAQYLARVEGTDMARLPYVIDILKLMPKVLVDKDVINVLGRGVPDIYVDNRKITENSELFLIPASKVKSVNVISQPGAEYDKTVQAVIVITLVHDDTDGFKLNESLRFDLTHKLSTNNELNLAWKRGRLSVDALLAYNEERNTFDKTSFKYHYKDLQLEGKEENVTHPDKVKQRLTGFLNAGYSFSAADRLSVRYSIMSLTRNREFIPENSQTNKVPETRHDIGLKFEGKIGEWKISVANDIFFDKIDDRSFFPTKTNYYLRDEFDTRTYLRASTPLWKGSLLLGAEHEYDYMDVDKYSDDLKPENRPFNVNREHSEHPDNTFAVYASTTQRFGSWTIEGGLRYEYQYSQYKPCKDDGLINMLDEYRPLIGKIEDYTENEIVKSLYYDGLLSTKYRALYPTLKVMKKFGESEFALVHTQSSVKPYLAHSRLGVKDYENLGDRILQTERVVTTSLNWKYQWMEMAAIYTKYFDPICSTMDGSVSYNAPGYRALDINATLSPQIGVLSPMLNINMHKQWFYMPLANGKDKLHRILLNTNFNNRFVLSGNWLIIIGAKWHSRGGERNVYFFKSDFSLNASIQKDFPRQRLTFILSAVNILNDSYFDVTRYTQAYRQISEGTRSRNTRMVSFTAQVRL